MRSLIYITVALLAAGCQLKSDSSTTTTTTGNGPGKPAANRSVVLTWGASTGTVQGYKIEISGDGATFFELGSVDSSATAVSVSKLYAGTKYYFRIRAFNQGANSGYGTIVPIAL